MIVGTSLCFTVLSVPPTSCLLLSCVFSLTASLISQSSTFPLSLSLFLPYISFFFSTTFFPLLLLLTPSYSLTPIANRSVFSSPPPSLPLPSLPPPHTHTHTHTDFPLVPPLSPLNTCRKPVNPWVACYGHS